MVAINEVKSRPQWVEILNNAVKEEGSNFESGSYRREGLYSILIRRLKELKVSTKKEIIPFSDVFGKLCRNFSISKKECWDILFLLRDVEIIEIVPFHGIKIK